MTPSTGSTALFVRFVRDDQRMIVERMGRYSRLCGPGWRLTIPFLERAFIVLPDSLLPGWRAYGAEQFEQKLVAKFYEVPAAGAR